MDDNDKKFLELSNSIISVNWDSFYTLRAQSFECDEAKKVYSDKLRGLVSLDIFSYLSKGNYSVQPCKVSGVECINPMLEDKILYFVNEKDARAVNYKFKDSMFMIHHT